MRRFLSSRLNGGYTQTNIVSDTPLVEESSNTDDVDSNDIFTEEFLRLSSTTEVY